LLNSFLDSDNYIKRTGIQWLAMSLKKLTEIQMIDIYLDCVKKPNTNQRRQIKNAKGEQRL